MGCTWSMPSDKSGQVHENTPESPIIRKPFKKGAKNYTRKQAVNKASWDILFLELVEAERDLTPSALSKLWDRYDPSGQGAIGKPQLKKFLLDWVHVIQRNYTDAIDEPLLFHFQETANERAFRAKNYLDVRKRGRVTFADFKRINDEEFWKLVNHDVLIDERLEGIRMWRKIFEHMDESGVLSDSDLGLIWNRYEKDEKELMGLGETDEISVGEIEKMLSDWIEACYVHYPGEVKLRQLQDFQDSVKIRAALAHGFLDRKNDSRVEYDLFKGLTDKSFWQTIDFHVSSADIVKALKMMKRTKLDSPRSQD